MSNQSKALKLVKNKLINKITDICENDFYLDKDNEDDIFTFNHSFNNYIIFQKYTQKNKLRYYFTLEKICGNLYVCVWFNTVSLSQKPSYLYSNYEILENDFLEEIEMSHHLSTECEDKTNGKCSCDYWLKSNDYNDIRQNYSLQYHKEVKLDTSDDEDKLFDFIYNFNFDECINCEKIDNSLSEGLCDNCLLKIDENMSEYPDECSICYDNDCLKFKVKTPCNHIFHKECLKKCRETRIKECNRNRNECPYCRTENLSFFNNL